MLWQNMDIHTKYSHEKFYNAVLILIGPGGFRERLHEALKTLMALEPQNFENKDTYKEFQNLRDKVTGGSAVPMQGDLNSFVQNSSSEEIAQAAQAIFHIQMDLQKK